MPPALNLTIGIALGIFGAGALAWMVYLIMNDGRDGEWIEREKGGGER